MISIFTHSHNYDLYSLRAVPFLKKKKKKIILKISENLLYVNFFILVFMNEIELSFEVCIRVLGCL